MNGRKCEDHGEAEAEEDEFGFKNENNQARKSSIGYYMNLSKPSALFVPQAGEMTQPDVSHIDLTCEDPRVLRYDPAALQSSVTEIKEQADAHNDYLTCPAPRARRPHDLLLLDDIFSLKEAQQEGSLNILLLESSCAVQPTTRAWCALESLAQQNPEAVVWYVMRAGVLNTMVGPAASLLRQYSNLRPVTADLRHLFSGTPLLRLYTTAAWNTNTTWPEVNLADLLRLALVWHLGGMYVDTDVVCIRDVTRLVDVIGWQETSTLGSGVFHLRRHHPFLQSVMQRVADGYQTNKWGWSGPLAFTQVMLQLCGGAKGLVPGGGGAKGLVPGRAGRCQGIDLLPIIAFYPVPASVWKTLFIPQAPRPVTQRYPRSYMIHTWNQLSYRRPIVKDSGSIYDQAARAFCPVTHAFATAYNTVY
ncbi:lactosylceramide 4-alpha-galactosyltransferase-like [Cherax quadricarinatus]|uniref:lactosylceramide 4-alpha-galactosyltransferase-like n=1 Tax=Cherax quadricarinatus TaxID=27406 RepID=UPI00387E3F42